ncbi:hypothetical protein LIER_43220 [Lithospermum erythrorhizon]|uniref:Uncharacterized protein n=1 Tax=Lithospermum erythrorhizon TaxID=34254 RepID=A0AAV3PQF1_LITER
MEDVCDDEQTNNEAHVEQPSIVSLVQIEQPSIVLEAQFHEPTITKQNIVDRKDKGKVVEPEVRKKLIRFTQGTIVEESVDDVVDGEQSQSQTQLPELDDNGDLVQLQADPDVLYGMFVDGFDNNELEKEVVLEREISNPFEACNTVDPGDDNNANNNSDGIVDDSDEVPIARTSGTKRQDGTYATYDKNFREGRTQGYRDSDADSDFVDNLLNDNASKSDIESLPSNSDEESQREKNIRFNERDLRNPELKVGVIFSSKKQATRAMIRYALKNRKKLAFYVSDKQRLKYKCKFPFVMEYLFKVWPEMEIPTLQVCVHKKYEIKISPNTARRMKEMALKKIDGDHVKQFKQIWDYSHELKMSHPGSTVLIEYEEPSGVFEANRFQRMYIYLKPLVDSTLDVEI